MSIVSVLVHLLVYIALVVLGHQIYQYMKSSFTTPKRVNMHQYQEKKYQEIMDSLQGGSVVALPPPELPCSSPFTDEQRQFLTQSLVGIDV